MASFNRFGIVPITPLNFTSGAAGTSRSNILLLANDTCHRLLVVRVVEEGTAPPHNAAAVKPKQPPVGPKRGTKVKILRKESYWYNGIGSVVAVDPDPKTHYRVVVRFDHFHYATISTNNYALDEIEEINTQ